MRVRGLDRSLASPRHWHGNAGGFGGSSKKENARQRLCHRAFGKCAGYSLVATVENVAVRLVPTVPNTVTAATAIKAAISPYSIAVAPSSFFKSLVKIANIPGPPLAADRRQHALDFLPNP